MPRPYPPGAYIHRYWTAANYNWNHALARVTQTISSASFVLPAQPYTNTVVSNDMKTVSLYYRPIRRHFF